MKLFETATKRNLRSFKGHTAGVRRTFFTADKQHIASFSDDKTVRLWDIPSQSCVLTYEDAHSDYIRAGCINPVSPQTLVSGGFDNKVKMYDTRTKSSVMEVDHGSTVHSVMFLPTGGIFISAGASHVKLWDAFAGRLIAMMSTHNRDITCLRLACNGRRLMSGGLDRKVKIYDTSTYQTVHTLEFPNAITSMAVAPDDETFVIGMTDGIVSVQRMDSDRKIKTLEKQKVPKIVSSSDQIVGDYKRAAEAKYNKCLRKFDYSSALKAVLNPRCTNQTPQITVGLMSELMRRKGLVRAIERQTDEYMVRIITFLIRYIGDRRFMRTIIDVSNVVLDFFEDDFSSLTGEVAKKFMELNKTLKREEGLLIDCIKLQGAFEQLMSVANVADQSSDIIDYVHEPKIKPSDAAEEDYVIDLCE